MNIYLITQNTNKGYDMFVSFVVVAPNAEEARRMHPRGDRRWAGPTDGGPGRWRWIDGSWGNPGISGWAHPSNVTVEHVGTAADGVKAGVLCASFNAG